MRKLLAAEFQYSSVMDHMHIKKIQSHFDFSLDSEGILFKTVRDHDKRLKIW